ncbi:MAG: pentapeptide repeat-containing protein [Gammaproteobacteria bacterium]
MSEGDIMNDDAQVDPGTCLPDGAGGGSPDAALSPVQRRRARSERVWASLRGGLPRPPGRKPLLIAGLAALATLIVLGILLRPASRPGSDCTAPAAAGVVWDFCAKTGVDAAGADLSGLSARSTTLVDAAFGAARLAGADLAYANLTAADLILADLSRARLVGANLTQARLDHAVLTGADLRFADLSGAVLSGADLAGARLAHAIWPDGRVCPAGATGGCGGAR